MFGTTHGNSPAAIRAGVELCAPGSSVCVPPVELRFEQKVTMETKKSIRAKEAAGGGTCNVLTSGVGAEASKRRLTTVGAETHGNRIISTHPLPD